MAKHDLSIEPPLMNAAGTLGFAPVRHSPVDWHGMGAFVTNPVSLARRTPAHGNRFIHFPGGFVLHTGYPNPGLTQVLRRFARQWARSPIPVIVHLLGRDPDEVARMARRLEPVEGVMGLEVGVTNDADPGVVSKIVQAASGELAVVACLPMEHPIEMAQAAMNAGAAAVSLAPPRGTYPAGDGSMMQGRLYGPAVLPLALKAVKEFSKLGVPVIGAGGVYTCDHKDAMLATGALAVQLDSIIWRSAGHVSFMQRSVRGDSQD